MTAEVTPGRSPSPVLLDGLSLEARHAAALVLQHSLLPTKPVATAGLEVAARYLPASGELGGDWYDFMRLPEGRIGIVMGDVMGHDLQAAVIMGRLRSALRAYALDEKDPARVLARLDRKITHFEQGAMATVLYAVAEHPYDELVISSAGHPPPVYARPGHPSEVVSVAADLPVGVDLAASRSTVTVSFERGSSLFLYTDGLVERRPTMRSGTSVATAFRIEALRQAATSRDPELACELVLGNLVGSHPLEDDAALLVVRRTE